MIPSAAAVGAAFLDSEDIVAKLHFIEQLEARWPYRPANGVPFSERIERALQQIPGPLRQFALAVFANVIYLPDALLRPGWRFLGEEAGRHLGTSSREAISSSLLLEVDPSGLIYDFFHENDVPGRLDTDKFARVGSIQDLVEALLLLECAEGDAELLRRSLRTALAKETWMILSDNALSGTSIASDIRRAQEIARGFAGAAEPKFISLVQVLTSDANAVLEQLHGVRTFRALYFDERFKIAANNPKCSLFKSSETQQGVVDLCKWLAGQEWFRKDPHLEATIEKSGDDMAFGFKGGGWTIVTPNAPTNSLPVVWYNNRGFYEGPFPRIMSRTSQASGGAGEMLKRALGAQEIIRRKLNGAGA